MAGPQAILAEKQLAVAETQAFLELVRQATAHFTVSQREFVVRQFVDLFRRARSAAVVTEVMIHYFHLMRGVTNGAIPDRNRLAELVSELQILSAEWLQHYPDDRWKMAVVLQAWHKTIVPCLTA
ncbi:MAG: hypothetical protein HQ546_04105 [Planctomycetes bacterium]|nr:hypothetical protein [Planctomycetota bacterium]